MDEVAEALKVLHEAGIDPRTLDVPGIAAAEGKSLVEVAQRAARARQVVHAHDASRGVS